MTHLFEGLVVGGLVGELEGVFEQRGIRDAQGSSPEGGSRGFREYGLDVMPRGAARREGQGVLRVMG